MQMKRKQRKITKKKTKVKKTVKERREREKFVLPQPSKVGSNLSQKEEKELDEKVTEGKLFKLEENEEEVEERDLKM